MTEQHSKGVPEYTSSVPRYTFPDTLQEQEAQLKENPMMQRFAVSRHKMSEDPYRPIYHFVSPESNMNDPNGLCFWQGRWHLFYQGYPPEETPRQHWGHTVSDDLIHWRDLPYAIYPSPEKCCWSGTTLVEENRVIAMYHGTYAGEMVAVSGDPLLLNWKKVTGKPVITVNSDGEPSLRDPCIWKKNGMYYSISATLTNNLEDLFSSEDLVNWKYLHPFVEGDRFTLVGDDGSCPNFWPIGDRHILLFFSHLSGGQYLLGDYDKSRDKFVVTSHGRFNFGPTHPAGVHAPSATPDGKNGLITIFNMNPGKPTEGWDQIMTLPRRMTLTGKDNLGIEPAGSVESLRYNHQHVDAMNLPANQEFILDNIRGKTMEIVAEINLNNAPMVEMNVLRSPNREEYTRIAFFFKRGYSYPNRYGDKRHYSLISIDSSYSSLLPDVLSRAPETAPVSLEEKESLKLRVFIDKSVIEVFVNGRQAVAMRVYPSRKDSLGVSLRSQGRNAELKSLDAWQMANI